MSNKFYTNYFKWGNKLYIRGYKETKNGEYEQWFDNYLLNDISIYSISNSNKPSLRKSFYGERNLIEHNFKTPKDADKFIAERKEFEELYGYSKYDVIKVNEIIPGEVKFNPKQIKILYFDIETYVGEDTDNGGLPLYGNFPNVFRPEHEICLITSLIDNNIYVYALQKTDDEWLKNQIKERFPNDNYKLHIVNFPTEKLLLNEWVKLLQRYNPDIVTGWNIDGFDIPYIHSRMSKHFSEKQVSNLSPFGIVTTRNGRDDFGNDIKLVDIKGISVVDYLSLYKKFELSPRPNYKLDTISGIELGVGKLDYDCSFREFYRNYFPREFTLYNIIDVIRVKELEQTCSFFGVTYELAYESKSNFIDVLSGTRLWANILYLALNDKNIELPSFISATQEEYEGAFVKPVIPGKYEFLVTFDIASLK